MVGNGPGTLRNKIREYAGLEVEPKQTNNLIFLMFIDALESG